jgi:hypothetical protein
LMIAMQALVSSRQLTRTRAGSAPRADRARPA